MSSLTVSYHCCVLMTEVAQVAFNSCDDASFLSPATNINQMDGCDFAVLEVNTTISIIVMEVLTTATKSPNCKILVRRKVLCSR